MSVFMFLICVIRKIRDERRQLRYFVSRVLKSVYSANPLY